MKLKQLILLVVVSGLLCVLSCAHDPKPSGPPTYYQGRLSVQNSSDVSIVIVDMTQRRGAQVVHRQLGNALGPGFSLALLNIIDPGGGLIFPGGDKVTVHFAADERDPNNPSQPLFQNSVQLTINGSFVLQVKSGGAYDINPG